jgi:hypothetical protein
MGVLMSSNAGVHQWDLTQENVDQIFYVMIPITYIAH